MRSISHAIFSALILLSVSAFAKASTSSNLLPLTGPYSLSPLTFDMGNCSVIEIGTSHLNNDDRLHFYTLSPALTEVLKKRRELILSEVAEGIRNHLQQFGLLEKTKRCGLNAFNKFRGKNNDLYDTSMSRHELGLLLAQEIIKKVDEQIFENAKRVAECQQWGICTGVGGKATVGYGRWVVGLGTFLTQDKVRSFTTDEASNHYNLELEATIKSPSVSVVGFIGIRTFLHFDRIATNDIAEYDIRYYPALPLKVTGKNTVGFGGTIGLGLVPVISHIAVFDNKVIRVRPTIEGLKGGCNALLSVVREKFLPQKRPEQIHPILHDDVQ